MSIDGVERLPSGGIKYRGVTFPGFNKPRSSNRPKKKKMVLAKKGDKVKVVHFGQKGYKHNYSAKAKKSYLARSAGIKGKDDKFSANYWARRVLWPSGQKADGSAKKTAAELHINAPNTDEKYLRQQLLRLKRDISKASDKDLEYAKYIHSDDSATDKEFSKLVAALNPGRTNWEVPEDLDRQFVERVLTDENKSRYNLKRPHLLQKDLGVTLGLKTDESRDITSPSYPSFHSAYAGFVGEHAKDQVNPKDHKKIDALVKKILRTRHLMGLHTHQDTDEGARIGREFAQSQKGTKTAQEALYRPRGTIFVTDGKGNVYAGKTEGKPKPGFEATSPYYFPGGGILEEGATHTPSKKEILDAVRKESLEELGFKIKRLKLLSDKGLRLDMPDWWVDRNIRKRGIKYKGLDEYYVHAREGAQDKSIHGSEGDAFTGKYYPIEKVVKALKDHADKGGSDFGEANRLQAQLLSKLSAAPSVMSFKKGTRPEFHGAKFVTPGLATHKDEQMHYGTGDTADEAYAALRKSLSSNPLYKNINISSEVDFLRSMDNRKPRVDSMTYDPENENIKSLQKRFGSRWKHELSRMYGGLPLDKMQPIRSKLSEDKVYTVGRAKNMDDAFSKIRTAMRSRFPDKDPADLEKLLTALKGAAKKMQPKKDDHPTQRLKERTNLDPKIIGELRQAIKKNQDKIPDGDHHVELDDGSRAVIKEIRRRHVLATILASNMNRYPGQNLQYLYNTKTAGFLSGVASGLSRAGSTVARGARMGMNPVTQGTASAVSYGLGAKMDQNNPGSYTAKALKGIGAVGGALAGGRLALRAGKAMVNPMAKYVSARNAGLIEKAPFNPRWMRKLDHRIDSRVRRVFGNAPRTRESSDILRRGFTTKGLGVNPESGKFMQRVQRAGQFYGTKVAPVVNSRLGNLAIGAAGTYGTAKTFNDPNASYLAKGLSIVGAAKGGGGLFSRGLTSGLRAAGQNYYKRLSGPIGKNVAYYTTGSGSLVETGVRKGVGAAGRTLFGTGPGSSLVRKGIGIGGATALGSRVAGAQPPAQLK